MSDHRIVSIICCAALYSCSFAELPKEFLPAIEATKKARGELDEGRRENTEECLVPGRFENCFNTSIPGKNLVKTVAPIEARSYPLTVECWVKCSNTNGYNVFISHYPKESRYHWELYSMAGSGMLSFFIPGHTPSNIISDFMVTDGKWHYVAAVFNEHSVILGMDGNISEEIAIAANNSLPELTGQLVIGAAYTSGSSVGCQGEIDEVRVSVGIEDIESVPTKPFPCDDKTVRLVHFDTLEKGFVFKDTCKEDVFYYPSDDPTTQGRTGELQQGFMAGVGSSNESDWKLAVSDAAVQALSGMGFATIKAVLVFDRLKLTDDERTAMLEQLAWFVPKELIFGCNGFGPISTETNNTDITILVLAGNIEVQASLSDLGQDDNPYLHSGRQLCEAVTEQIANTPPGSHHVAILLGDMHVPDHDTVTIPFKDLVQRGVIVTGAAHPREGCLFYRGEIRHRHCMSLLVSGDFRCKTSMEQGKGLEGTVTSAIVASQKTCDAQIKPKLVMVFNCASRLSTLDKDVMRELYGIKSVYGDVPIAGFYSSGEIGPVEGETLIGGRGQMISICSIYSN